MGENADLRECHMIRKFQATGPEAKFLSRLNEIIEAVNRIKASTSLDSITSSTVNGTTRRLLTKPAPGGGRIRQFRFKTEFNKYLSCVFWDAENEEEGDTVFIAKPALLRNETKTVAQYGRSVAITAGASPYLRSIVYDTQTWPEYVWPAYVENDVIYAVKVSDPIGDLDQTGNDDVTYVDLNVDGRKWLKELDVCLDNADRKQLIEGSEIYG